MLWQTGRITLSAGNYNSQVFSAETQARIEELEARDGAGSADAIAPNWRVQLGSLGSGNHFIEVSLDELDRVWLFLHSGSRGVGKKLATRHIKVARGQCERRRISLPDADLAYLVEGEPEFWAYIRDLRWAQHFALLNRQEMMHRVIESVRDWYGDQVTILETVQCHHNYTEQETHFGKRSGCPARARSTPARQARADSRLDGHPLLCRGRQGQPARSQQQPARRRPRVLPVSRAQQVTRAQLDEAMAGVEWRRSDAFLDEIPAAYKDIDIVMANAAALVEVRHTLRQIVNVKGD